MTPSSEAIYWHERAQSSRTAALDTIDICARSAHTRMAAAYDIRSKEAEVAIGVSEAHFA